MILPTGLNRDQLKKIPKQDLIDLFEVLLARTHQLETQVQEQAATIQRLQDQMSKNSRNSGKSPSSDRLKKPRSHSLRRESAWRPGKIVNIFQYLFVSLYLLLFLLAAMWGPDLGRYLRWAQVFQQLDWEIILSKGGNILSPMGIPLTQWSHGPGLLFSLCPSICYKFINLYWQAVLISWGFTIIFWWAMIRLLRHAAYEDAQWTIFGILIAILGTHLGFYSRSYASETLSFVFFGVMALWIVTSRKWKFIDTLMMGCLAGFLAITRSYLLLYTLPLFGAMVYSILKTRETRSHLNTFILLVSPLLPLLIGLIQVGMANRWMTGDFFGSPYQFGNEAFRSLDFAHPEFLTVLFHSWHGLFSHHPLYAMGFIALVLLTFQEKSIPMKLFYISFILVILVHLYLQSAWYVWWLGIMTFGMRGMSISAIVLVLALIRLMRERELQNKSNALLSILILASCLWSTFLFYDNLYDETQFVTHRELFEFQYGYLIRTFRHLYLVFGTVLLIILFVIFLAKSKKLGFLYEPFVIKLKQRPIMTVSQMFIFPMSLYPLVFYNLNSYDYYLGSKITIIKYLVLATIPVSVILIGGFLVTYDFYCAKVTHLSKKLVAHMSFTRVKNIPIPELDKIVAGLLIILFVVSTVAFANLAIYTEKQIAACSFPKSQVQYVSSVHVAEVEESYYEYLNVPGFEPKKEALRTYLEELKATTKIEDEGEIFSQLEIDCVETQ